MTVEATFLADPAFPHLGIAGDPGAMREVLQEHLRPLEGKVYHVRDCRISRVRYRKGARCVLQYVLRLAEPGTDYELIQWVTGVIYAEGRSRRKWEKLRASDPGQYAPGAFLLFEPYAFVPDLGMLVEVFPYDRRLPTLPRLMAGPVPEIEARLLARFGPGSWRTEAWNVDPVRYRAELGATLRLTVRAMDDATGRREERSFYAKVYHDDAGEHTHDVLRTLSDRAATGKGFVVGEPVAYFGDLRTLIQEETAGTTLRDTLLQNGGSTPAIGRIAEALAALHLEDGTARREHPVSKEVADLERTGRLLRWSCPHLRAEIEATLAAVVAGLEEVPPTPAHLDLKLDHILLDGDRVALIDFDGFSRADPVLDTANVLAHLTAMPLLYDLPRDRLRTTARSFAEEYFARVPEAWRARLPVHYAGATLKTAVGFFRRQEPGWSDNISILVKEAANSLAGRVW